MKPILIVSDSPDCPSGLGRLGRDLAEKLHEHGATVWYCGYWGKGTGKEPYQVCQAGKDPTVNLFPIGIFADALRHAQGECVVLTLYDPMWMAPLGLPGLIKDGATQNETFVSLWAAARKSKGIELWGSFPVDAHCPTQKLPSMACEGLLAWDRVASWTLYGARILLNSQAHDIDVLPPGISWGWEEGIPKRVQTRKELGLKGYNRLLGVVATNQQRKDWGLVFQAMGAMPNEWHLWAHIPRLIDYWNIPSLLEEYNLVDRVHLSHQMPDGKLAEMYAACDLTFAPGKGEGYGYPILESQLAGTPCVAINYAGGAELTHNHVEPVAWKPEGPCSFLRPVVRSEDLVERLLGPMHSPEARAWAWENVWIRWERWFRDGGVL